MRTCCVKYCRSESFRGCGISFYSIPKKEPIRQKWMDAIGFVPKKKDAAVCSSHFRPEELTFSGMRAQVTPGAVPSIFPVAVIFGILGACRRQELYNLKVKDVADSQNMLAVGIINSKNNKIDRKFTISGPYYDICKKYMDLRPRTARISKYFFVRYYNGRCLDLKIGINKFGAMGKVVAKELNLPNPELYTGHCFKRTSVNLFDADAGGVIRLLRKSWHCWQPIAESCTETLKTEQDYSLNGVIKTEPTAPLIAQYSPGPSQSTSDTLDSDASTEEPEEPLRQVFSVSNVSTKPQVPLGQVFSVSNVSTKPQEPLGQVFSVSNVSTKPQEPLGQDFSVFNVSTKPQEPLGQVFLVSNVSTKTQGPLGQVFSVSNASAKPQDPLKQDTKQCRFCGKYSKDCIPISPTHLASFTTKLAFNDIVVQFSETLPKTVCKDCDVKLQVIYDFVKYAKAAQELLMDVEEDGEEMVEVKNEAKNNDETYELEEDNGDEEREDRIVDLFTAGETIFLKENEQKRKSISINVIKPKKAKVTKSDSCNEETKNMSDRNEVIDRDDTNNDADNIELLISDKRTNKTGGAKFATRVFVRKVRKVRIDGNS